jgi:transposase
MVRSDIGGSRTLWRCLPTAATPVKEFGCFTQGLHEMAFWMIGCGITVAALESTGAYWIPVFEALESHGIEVMLVNARCVKNVSGRKSDALDCKWLQQLAG